jgi:uncharacterized membrane protein
MISCRELRARARVSLGGNIFKPKWLFALLVYFIATAILGMAANTIVGTFILMGPIMVGICSYFITLIRTENSEEDLGAMFNGFKTGFGDNMVTGLLVTIFTFLWSLLFIIPGIVKSYSYAMAFYIRNDHPEYTATEAITKSREMMKGYKGKLFLLDLSFIGWAIIGMLCCGIGILWVYPYMEMARAHFYQELKNKQEPIVPPLSEDAPTEETTEA